MQNRNHRVPLALALAALFAAALVPISGADSTTPLYTFQVGAPGDPKWVILQLNVTEEGAIPHVNYHTPKLSCPMTWGTYFMTGTPSDARTYNSLTFSFHAGRNGVDVYGDTPVFGFKRTTLQNDGAEYCSWFDWNVIYGELPVGTVYMLHMVTGMPFEATSTFTIEGSGVSVVNVSSGRSTFHMNDTDFAGTASVVALGPPWCGAIEVPCDPGHMNEGGGYGAAVEVNRFWPITFKKHPFWRFEHYGGLRVSNASVELPDGSMRYENIALAKVGPLNVLGGGLGQHNMGDPPGKYWFRILASAEASSPAQALVGPPGWYLSGADLRFPGE